MVVFFVSDLHLCDSRPHIARIFLNFLQGAARRADALYVLGDLFEYWAGDDDLDAPFNASIAEALCSYTSAGSALRIMHGNRDFLLGARFARACNGELIGDPHTVEIDGTPTLLMHGDTLCTDDRAYLRFRDEVRNPGWISQFLALPLADRKRKIEALRETSETEKRRKTPEIMDVNPDAVVSAFRAHSCPRLIHGHTHRPARHEHEVDGRMCERWVLADWYRAGSYLSYEPNLFGPVQLG